MRVSVEPGDPGFVDDGWRYRVLFNGAAAENVITADEEQRAIVCLAIDDRGRPVIERRDGGQRFKKVVKVGDVKIEKRERRDA
jgi:hypothetical protein